MHVHTLTTLPEDWNDPVLTREAAYSLLTQPHHVMWAVGQGGSHGYLLARLMPGTMADVLTLFVPPAHRRKGYAKALLEATLAAARTIGCAGLTLEVNATNAAAIQLYTVCGLQQVGKRPSYYPVNSPTSVSNQKADALVLAVTFA